MKYRGCITFACNSIIFECKDNHFTHAWNVIKSLCKRKNISWPENFNITSIMALPISSLKSEDGQPRPSTSCFLLITTSKCKKLLNNSNPPASSSLNHTEVKNKLITTLNIHLKLDCTITNRRKYHNKVLPEKLILNTWNGTPRNESSLPTNWLRASWVLVGISDHPQSPYLTAGLDESHTHCMCKGISPWWQNWLAAISNPRILTRALPTSTHNTGNCVSPRQWVPPKKKIVQKLTQL